MEQRPLRLGDILDDYCPRERRLTNHAVVAMIEEDIKQTRCTTCDAEHAYKGGKAPRRRKKESPAALYKEVLAGMPDTEAAPALAAAGHLALDVPVMVQAEPIVMDTDRRGDAIAAAREEDSDDEDGEPMSSEDGRGEAPSPERLDSREDLHDVVDDDGPREEVEEGPVHRPLIRAQLPRIEGHKEERRLPEFTIRQPGGRGGNGHFRGGGGGDPRMKQQQRGGPGAPGGAGNRPHGGPRFSGSRPAAPGRGGPAGRGGSPSGFRAGQPRHSGPKKRSR